jgi:hypothetical protein
MINSETTKIVLLSILNLGESSPLFNQFYQICINFSVATLSLGKNRRFRNDLMSKLDCSVQDLACDCIADLFEKYDGKFIHIEKYFSKQFQSNITSVNSEVIQTHLAVIIKSKTNQRISALREETGEIYFKVKKIVGTVIKRKKDLYKSLMVNGIKYLSYNHNKEIKLDLPQVEINYIVSKLLSKTFKKNKVTDVINAVFETLSDQDVYCKALQEKLLIDYLKEYFLLKMGDSISQTVEYITYEEEDSSLNTIENVGEYERD